MNISGICGATICSAIAASSAAGSLSVVKRSPSSNPVRAVPRKERKARAEEAAKTAAADKAAAAAKSAAAAS